MLLDLGTDQKAEVQRYLEVLFDPESNLSKQFPNIEERRKYVAKQYLGKFKPEQVDAIVNFKDPQLIDMLIVILRNYHNMEFAAMVAQEQQVYSLIKSMHEPLDDLDVDKKLKAVETQAKISSLLPEAMARYKGYKNLVYSGVQEEEQQQITRKTPEKYAATATLKKNS